MFALTTCLLLATSALAADIDSTYQVSVRPIDFSDDFHLRANPAPGHIFFNFQQMRLDQPPQVEIRDEDVGRYMYRTRTTPGAVDSTTMIPVEEIRFDVLPFSNVQSEKRYPSVDIWRPQSTTKAPPTPPTTLKWNEFSENVQIDNNQYYPPQWYSQPLFVPERPFKPQAQSTVAPVVQFAEIKTRPSAPAFAPTRTNIEESQPVAHSWQEPRPLGPNRGSHKFKWDDVLLPLPPPDRKVETRMTPAPTTSYVPSTPPAAHGPRVYPGGAAPPPPTLTPWQGDNLR